MDPLTFYTIGLARHLEMIREAEEQRLAETLYGEPPRWQRLIARFMPTKRAQQPCQCPDALASAQ